MIRRSGPFRAEPLVNARKIEILAEFDVHGAPVVTVLARMLPPESITALPVFAMLAYMYEGPRRGFLLGTVFAGESAREAAWEEFIEAHADNRRAEQDARIAGMYRIDKITIGGERVK